MTDYPITDFYNEQASKRPSDTIKSLLETVCKEFGIANITYTRVVDYSMVHPETLLLGTYSDAWVERYQTRKYYFIDPLVPIAGGVDKPVFWSDIRTHSVEEDNFFADALQYGILDTGLLIPLGLSGSGFATFVINSRFENDTVVDGSKRFVKDMECLALIIHEAVPAGNNVKSVGLTLLPKEVEILRWLSMGRSVDEISLIRGEDRVSIDEDLSNCRTKLSVKTDEQAIQVAQSLRII